jgi:uncharacterized FAD-dependent dehydrogenase
MPKEHDVLIVGAGQAGMFAAHELAKAPKKLNVLIVEQGPDIRKRKCPMETTGWCASCKPCEIMCGVGGAGTFSDGTLNLRPDIGGDLDVYTKDNKKSWELVDYVDKIFLKYGAPKHLYKATSKGAEDLKRKAAAAGVEFIEINQRHIGSDHAPKLIQKFTDDLKKRGIRFMTDTTVEDLIIEKGVCEGVILKGGKKLYAKKILAAPGRVGSSWLDRIIAKHKIKSEFGPIDVGVRVEVPSVIMEPIIKINRDPKFRIRSKKYDDLVRTFCTNFDGFVVKETYDGYIGVNGHSLKSKKSDNTNFAFLSRINLTEPIENTTEYGRSIAELATTIGGGKPILQRMGDLTSGRRSTPERIERNQVKNTLRDVTPGDISMAMPHRVVMNIIEGLEQLNEVIPGVASDSTLLYAPEIKFYATRVEVDGNMESSVRNLFAAGDGAGMSRDIVNAAATGVLAARGILGK